MSEAPKRVWIQFDEFPTGEDAWRALPDPDAAGLDPLYVSEAALRELCEKWDNDMGSPPLIEMIQELLEGK